MIVTPYHKAQWAVGGARREEGSNKKVKSDHNETELETPMEIENENTTETELETPMETENENSTLPSPAAPRGVPGR